MALQFRLRPKTIEAMPFKSATEINEWAGKEIIRRYPDEWRLHAPVGWAPLRRHEWIMKDEDGGFWRCSLDELLTCYEFMPGDESDVEIYNQWVHERSVARPYEEFRAEMGLT